MIFYLDYNVEFLLKLADFFDMQSLFKKCEDYLKTTKRISDARKLLLADKRQRRNYGKVRDGRGVERFDRA